MASSAIPAECKPYRPRGAAKDLFPCRDPEVLISGGAGTGKTIAVCTKAFRWLLKCPGSRACFVRKTRASMTESVLVTLESNVIPDNPALYPDVHSQLRSTRRSYIFPNGSELIIAGLDNPDRIMSTEYDMCCAFESTELVEDDWEKLTTRLRNGKMPFQQAIADCNPSSPSHWLNQRANRAYAIPAALAGHFPSARPGQKQMTRLNSRHEDNPMLWDGEKWTERGAIYLSKLHNLTGARKFRLLNGIWAAQEGLVYPEFDQAIHVIEPFAIPDSWRRIRVLDFGFVAPCCCQWWAFDQNDRAYLYREIYKTQTLIQDLAKEITDLSGSERFEVTIADPEDAEGRATLHKYGVPNIAARKEKEVGIEAVKLRLRKQADGKPMMFLFRDCRLPQNGDSDLMESRLPTSTEQEFDGYIWQKVAEGKAVKEEPLKQNDHGMDCIRYMSMHRKIVRHAAMIGTINQSTPMHELRR